MILWIILGIMGAFILIGILSFSVDDAWNIDIDIDKGKFNDLARTIEKKIDVNIKEGTP